MRVTFIVSFVANVVLTLVARVILPGRVAIHFGAEGMPDNWASNHLNTLILLAIHVVLFATLLVAPRLTFLAPTTWINLPNKRFWLKPENRHQALTALTTLVHAYGTAVFAFLFAIGLLSIKANLATPVRLNLPLFFLSLALFLIGTAAWGIAVHRAFRVPDAAA